MCQRYQRGAQNRKRAFFVYRSKSFLSISQFLEVEQVKKDVSGISAVP